MSDLLTRAYRGEARMLIERSGIPVAAIISPDDLERLEHYDAERAKRFKVLEEMREAFKDVPPEEIEKKVDTIIEEVRREQRSNPDRQSA